jgi:hypothetical protein
MDALRRRPRHARGTLSGSTNLYKSGPHAALERATCNRQACHVAGGLRAGARLCRLCRAERLDAPSAPERSLSVGASVCFHEVRSRVALPWPTPGCRKEAAGWKTDARPCAT